MNPVHRGCSRRRTCSSPSSAGRASGAYAELRGIDFAALARQTGALSRATEDAYPRVVEPELRGAPRRSAGSGARRGGPAPVLPRRRPRRAASPPGGWCPSFARRWPGSGSTSTQQPNIMLDAEQRPTKSPRAFCAPVRVPDEVYLVVAPVGGRERLRGALPRGRARRALRAHGPGARLRVPLPRRQLGDRVVRLPASSTSSRTRRGSPSGWAPTARPRSRARARGEARTSCAATARSSATSSSCTARPPTCGDARPLRASCSARRPGRLAATRTGSTTSTRASTSPATCGRGRSRRTGAARCASASASGGSGAGGAGSGCAELWSEGQRLPRRGAPGRDDSARSSTSAARRRAQRLTPALRGATAELLLDLAEISPCALPFASRSRGPCAARPGSGPPSRFLICAAVSWS